MAKIDQLEALFPGRGAMVMAILRNHGLLMEDAPPSFQIEIVVVSPEPEPEPEPEVAP